MCIQYMYARIYKHIYTYTCVSNLNIYGIYIWLGFYLLVSHSSYTYPSSLHLNLIQTRGFLQLPMLLYALCLGSPSSPFILVLPRYTYLAQKARISCHLLVKAFPDQN